MAKYKIYAHRGNVGSQLFFENTVDNSKEAIECSLHREHVYGIELDIRATGDGEIVAVHNDSLKRIAVNAEDILKTVSEIPYEELRNIPVKDIGYYYKGFIFRSCFLSPRKQLRTILKEKLSKIATIPLLTDIYDLRTKQEILTEIKDTSDICLDRLIEIVNQYKEKRNISIHGYDGKSVLRLKEKTGVLAGQLAGFTAMKTIFDKSYIENEPFDFYSVMWNFLTVDLMIRLITSGKQVNFWTIDSINHLKYVTKLCQKVEDELGYELSDIGIITNVPDIINTTLQSQGRRIQRIGNY